MGTDFILRMNAPFDPQYSAGVGQMSASAVGIWKNFYTHYEVQRATVYTTFWQKGANAGGIWKLVVGTYLDDDMTWNPVGLGYEQLLQDPKAKQKILSSCPQGLQKGVTIKQTYRMKDWFKGNPLSGNDGTTTPTEVVYSMPWYQCFAKGAYTMQSIYMRQKVVYDVLFTEPKDYIDIPSATITPMQA